MANRVGVNVSLTPNDNKVLLALCTRYSLSRSAVIRLALHRLAEELEEKHEEKDNER